MRLTLLCFALWAAAVAQHPEEALDEASLHELRAQQALADSLADAMALLQHGSDRSKEGAAQEIAQMAVATTISQPFHPVTFRNACVKAGIVEQLVKLLNHVPQPATPTAQRFALEALEAIATDDPTTDLDNGHAMAVCKAGATRHVIGLLGSPDESVQVAAAGCAAILAECRECQAMLTAQGAEEALVMLGTFGNDVAKLRAVAALELLALHNPKSQQRIAQAGGRALLDGLERYGGQMLRSAAGDLAGGFKEGAARPASVDSQGHARAAHDVRRKHSRIWQEAVGIQRAYAPS